VAPLTKVRILPVPKFFCRRPLAPPTTSPPPSFRGAGGLKPSFAEGRFFPSSLPQPFQRTPSGPLPRAFYRSLSANHGRSCQRMVVAHGRPLSLPRPFLQLKTPCVPPSYGAATEWRISVSRCFFELKLTCLPELPLHLTLLPSDPSP